jgi:hypothetical protein
MRRLPDNLALDETAMRTCLYSMFSTEQCPKALAWMAALSVANGNYQDAEAWIHELIEALVFAKTAAPAHGVAANSFEMHQKQ